MPPEDERVTLPEIASEPSHKAELTGIYDKFFALSAEIEVSNDNMMNAMRTTTVISGYRFSVLTKDQDEDLFRELARVNKLLGQARTILDSYIQLENSTPNFKNHFNLIYDLMKRTEKQRETAFFEYHVTLNGKYLYPTRVLENMLREMTGLFGRLCGTLQGAGEYILDSEFLGGSGDSTSNTRGHSNGYPYRNGHNKGMGAPEHPETETTTRERDLGM